MKIDAIKAKIERFKEIFKVILYSILAIISGIVTIVYNILIHKIPPYMIIVGGIGLVVVFLLILVGKTIWNTFDELEKELENA